MGGTLPNDDLEPGQVPGSSAGYPWGTTSVRGSSFLEHLQGPSLYHAGKVCTVVDGRIYVVFTYPMGIYSGHGQQLTYSYSAPGQITGDYQQGNSFTDSHLALYQSTDANGSNFVPVPGINQGYFSSNSDGDVNFVNPVLAVDRNKTLHIAFTEVRRYGAPGPGVNIWYTSYNIPAQTLTAPRVLIGNAAIGSLTTLTGTLGGYFFVVDCQNNLHFFWTNYRSNGPSSSVYTFNTIRWINGNNDFRPPQAILTATTDGSPSNRIDNFPQYGFVDNNGDILALFTVLKRPAGTLFDQPVPDSWPETPPAVAQTGMLIFRSSDSGASYSIRYVGRQGSNLATAAGIDSQSNLYVVLTGGDPFAGYPDSTLFKSSDRGATWSNLGVLSTINYPTEGGFTNTSPLDQKLLFVGADNRLDYVYLDKQPGPCGGGGGLGDIFGLQTVVRRRYSTDGGVTWSTPDTLATDAYIGWSNPWLFGGYTASWIDYTAKPFFWFQYRDPDPAHPCGYPQSGQYPVDHFGKYITQFMQLPGRTLFKPACLPTGGPSPCVAVSSGTPKTSGDLEFTSATRSVVLTNGTTSWRVVIDGGTLSTEALGPDERPWHQIPADVDIGRGIVQLDRTLGTRQRIVFRGNNLTTEAAGTDPAPGPGCQPVISDRPITGEDIQFLFMYVGPIIPDGDTPGRRRRLVVGESGILSTDIV